MKGYSGVTDSARLVQVFHAWNFGAHARVWWEYVPTKANPSDLPSRQDPSQEVWEVAPGVTSTPVSAVLPPLDRWSDPAGWARQAQFVVEDWALVEPPAVPTPSATDDDVSAWEQSVCMPRAATPPRADVEVEVEAPPVDVATPGWWTRREL